MVWAPPNPQGLVLPQPRRDYRYNMESLLDLLLRNVQLQAVFKTVQGTFTLFFFIHAALACRMNQVKIDFASTSLQPSPFE